MYEKRDVSVAIGQAVNLVYNKSEYNRISSDNYDELKDKVMSLAAFILDCQDEGYAYFIRDRLNKKGGVNE